MDYKKFAEALGLKMEVSHLQELNICSVVGPTKRVLAFRRETFVHGLDWYVRDDGTSSYYFVYWGRR